MLGVIKKQVAISRNLKESFGRKFVRAMWCVVFLTKAILCGLRSMRRECLGSAVYHNGKRRFISNWAGTGSPTICGEDDFYQKDVPRSELISERSLSEFLHRFRFGFRFYATNWLGIDVNRRVYGLIVVFLAFLSGVADARL